MRAIQTFILRLLVDSNEPHAMRGLIHSVTNGEELPFSDGPNLLALLGRMVDGAPGIVPRDPAKKTGEEQ